MDIKYLCGYNQFSNKILFCKVELIIDSLIHNQLLKILIQEWETTLTFWNSAAWVIKTETWAHVVSLWG